MTDGFRDEHEMEVTLQQLRMDLGRAGLATMLEEMVKLCRIRELKLPNTLFSDIAQAYCLPA
jgi:hypothetical protein